jgi:hypothetical protein
MPSVPAPLQRRSDQLLDQTLREWREEIEQKGDTPAKP